MSMDVKIHQLNKEKFNYEFALNNWRKFCKNVEDYPKYFSQRWGDDVEFPETTISENSIVISVAETTLECRFDYVGNRSLLRFGYIASQPTGEELFVESSRLHIDSSGNILDKLGGEPTSHCLQASESVDEVLFGECVTALRKNWADLLEE